jgi:uncharacterized membrane protein YesL
VISAFSKSSFRILHQGQPLRTMKFTYSFDSLFSFLSGRVLFFLFSVLIHFSLSIRRSISIRLNKQTSSSHQSKKEEEEEVTFSSVAAA